MINFDDLIAFKNEIRTLVKSKKFDLAANIFRKNENFILDSSLLIIKATVIQLAENSNFYSLDDARNSLILATILDDDNINAWNELGYFYYSVDDNAKEALLCFKKSISLAQQLYISSSAGIAKVFAELDDLPSAISYLKNTKFIEESKVIENLLLELKSD